MSEIEVRTKECYILELAKNHVVELIKLSKQMDHPSYLDGLLNSLYEELEYQHNVLRSPELSQLASRKQRHPGQG